MAKIGEKFISESGYYDVESQKNDRHRVFVPDVEAENSDEAIKRIAERKGVAPESLEVFEASNPGYREE